ncbi:hypothetical protein M9H77_26729 [Catharanthus roseus]|uniref:Uncharacterized protein n=1 Tax=Catharanthus roseus TaxID=4058 RepID=A0ACC0ABH8_CATRO|nr:hypothetical protein M9H77_26729 [Catharanthus roseus]
MAEPTWTLLHSREVCFDYFELPMPVIVPPKMKMMKENKNGAKTTKTETSTKKSATYYGSNDYLSRLTLETRLVLEPSSVPERFDTRVELISTLLGPLILHCTPRRTQDTLDYLFWKMTPKDKIEISLNENSDLYGSLEEFPKNFQKKKLKNTSENGSKMGEKEEDRNCQH